MAATSRHPSTRATGERPPPDTRVDLRTTSVGAHVRVVVSGEADPYTADALRDDLRATLTPDVRSVTVEVHRLEFCDLAGLAALNDFCREASAAGVTAEIRGMSPLLTWMHAAFPTAHGHRASGGGPAAAPGGATGAALSGADTSPAPAPPAAPQPPRAWPER